MNKANNYTPSRTEAGNIVPAMSTGNVDATSFVVGKYTEDGRKISKGETAGGSQMEQMLKQKMLESMSNKGRLSKGYVMTAQGPMKLSTVPPPMPTIQKKAGKKGK